MTTVTMAPDAPAPTLQQVNGDVLGVSAPALDGGFQEVAPVAAIAAVVEPVASGPVVEPVVETAAVVPAAPADSVVVPDAPSSDQSGTGSVAGPVAEPAQAEASAAFHGVGEPDLHPVDEDEALVRLEIAEAAARSLGRDLADLRALRGPLAQTLRERVSADVESIWQQRLTALRTEQDGVLAAAHAQAQAASDSLVGAQAEAETARTEAREASGRAAAATDALRGAQQDFEQRLAAADARAEQARGSERTRISVAVRALARTMTSEAAPASKEVVEALGARMVEAVTRLTDQPAGAVPSLPLPRRAEDSQGEASTETAAGAGTGGLLGRWRRP